jgi:hypothetical protein
LPIDPAYATAGLVPVIWWVVRRIRRRHTARAG